MDDTTVEKSFYITTAIPYVNGVPHIGNALDYLQGDIIARYARKQGKSVRFQVGTDEHGNKIAAKAAQLGMTPQAYTDSSFVNFESLMRKIGASYTDFIRTTDDHHKASVQYIWQQLQPHIYKDSYDGWYCMGHEAFFTEKEVAETNGVCVDHQAPYEHVKEENYFLRASTFSEQIREAIETDKMKIVPEYRKKEFLEMIKDGVKDVSISRPRRSLSWGVPVPNDPEQIMYVWLDALSNYITVLGYPDRPEYQNFWPADVQVVGKDILRFHAGIWPAMLLGLGLELPKVLLVHGFINVDGAKISKTVGNGVDPNDVIDKYGLDAFRYFFSRHIPTQDDGDFTWERFEIAYNTELANDLGNLISRVENMVNKYEAGVVSDGDHGEHDIQQYIEAMNDYKFNVAMDEIWGSIRDLNRYIEMVKPWEVAKRRDTDPDATDHLTDILGHCTATILQIADQLEPLLPDTAKKIHDTFATGVIVNQGGVLFPRIELPPATVEAPVAPLG